MGLSHQGQRKAKAWLTAVHGAANCSAQSAACAVTVCRYSLQLGWYVVKNPNQAALLRGTSSVAARQQEDMFFESTAPWNRMSSDQKSRLGEATVLLA